MTRTCRFRSWVCQAYPTTGQCISPIGPYVTTLIDEAGTPTFMVVVVRAALVPFDPAINRVFVRLTDADHPIRGAASVTVRTQHAHDGGATGGTRSPAHSFAPGAGCSPYYRLPRARSTPRFGLEWGIVERLLARNPQAGCWMGGPLIRIWTEY